MNNKNIKIHINLYRGETEAAKFSLHSLHREIKVNNKKKNL